jgi:hypothetical protein
MMEVGFNVSEHYSLPLLFKEVFGIELRMKCSECRRSGWESLRGWLRKREPKQKCMYRIKKEYAEKTATFVKNGMRISINSSNLNEERALLMLSSKYAHWIEGESEQPKGKVPNVSEVVTVSTSENQKQGVVLLRKKGKKKLSKSSL